MLQVAKLVSREFVIGRLNQNVLINVFVINFKADSISGQIGISLTPYMAPIDTSLSPVIGLDKTICMITPNQELTQQYIMVASKFIADVKREMETNKTETNNPESEIKEEIKNDSISEVN